jgi:quercetin dioxygenase-like cupin family protein
MPFINLNEMPGEVISPGHSTANGPTVTGNELEIGYYTEPKNSGAKPHHHKSEQMMLVLEGRLRMRIGDETREIGPGELALISSDLEHEQIALEENTRFVSFKRSVGTQPPDEE